MKDIVAQKLACGWKEWRVVDGVLRDLQFFPKWKFVAKLPEHLMSSSPQRQTPSFSIEIEQFTPSLFFLNHNSLWQPPNQHNSALYTGASSANSLHHNPPPSLHLALNHHSSPTHHRSKNASVPLSPLHPHRRNPRLRDSKKPSNSYSI